MPKNKTLVVGIGNSYRRDDGIGPAAIEILKEQAEILHADFFDGGIDPLNLLEPLAQYERAVIIDAANMQQPPGTIAYFPVKEAQLRIKESLVSTHGFGLLELISLIEQLTIAVKLYIIAIQPEDISLGEGLSETIKEQLPKIIQLVRENI